MAGNSNSDRPARRWNRETVRVVLWIGVVALGLHLFLAEFLPALRERRQTIHWVRTIEQENSALEKERDAIKMRANALEAGDPTTIQQALRDHGYVPEDRVRIVEENSAPERRRNLEDTLTLRGGR